MKKRLADSSIKLAKVLVCFLLVFLAFSMVQAQEETEDPIDNAYACLEDRVDENCDTLSTEEKVFSLLAINQCEEELIDDSSEGECWPLGSCRLKTTSQAVLALNHVGEDTDDAQQWLSLHNRTAPELTWYLQVESPEETTCTIRYSGLTHTVTLNEDKTLEGNPGPGLSIAEGGYWLQINQNFYSTDFEVSCAGDFLTNLLFKKSDSSTVHVYPTSSSAAAQGTTTERVESLCFEENGVCNYEGSLWAAFVLNSLGEDISSFLPYLITVAEDNERFLPESFLYALTSNTDYRTTLLSKQIASQRWEESGDRFYDTAFALYPFQAETFAEKTNSQEWLLSVQDSDGCWAGGNVRNTAFILESLWPKDFVGSSGSGGSGTGTPIGCEASGNYCVPSGQCGGQIITESSCAGSVSSVCCSIPQEQLTCSELGGALCSSSETCVQGQSTSSSDSIGSSCCVGGLCQPKETTPPTGTGSECENQDGICRVSSCISGETSAPYSCSFSGDTCCISSTSSGGDSDGNLTWLWILLVLIVLVTLGIIFRDKLRHFWLKVKSKFGGGKSKSGPKYGGPRGPPPFMSGRRPTMERRILPRPHPHPRPSPRPSPERRPQGNKELDDVLKKLKDMSK